MGKKGNWFSSLKKALHPKKSKAKKKESEKEKNTHAVVSSSEEIIVPPQPPPAIIPSHFREDVKLSEANNEQSKHAYSVALATAVAAEAAVAAAQAAAEVVRLTTVAHYSGRSKEETAAIKIQTAFRGYLARRALRALRGLVRLKTLIKGQSVKRQASSTLRAMQTLSRLQSQVCARRIRMSEENLALQHQLQLKHEKELERLRASIGEQWDDSTQSREKIEASLIQKQEAAMRRERALAYAFSHQQNRKSPSKSANLTFMDPNNPRWGWSWLERWMAARPWESRSTIDNNNDRASVKSSTSRAMSGGEMTRGYSPRRLNYDNKLSPSGQKSSRPPSRQSPSTPSKAPSTPSVTGRMKPATPRGSAWGGDDDLRSMFSAQSDRFQRHSIAGSSARDDESLANSPSVPGYMAPTQSAKAKSRFSGPLGPERNATPDKASMGSSAKKHLSFSGSPAGSRRHSGPPRFDMSIIRDIEVLMREKVSNGERGR